MTAAGKVTTAALQPGTVILLRRLDDGQLDATSRKTGTVKATVVAIRLAPQGQYDRVRRYIVSTDMGDTVSLAPAQTHWLAPS